MLAVIGLDSLLTLTGLGSADSLLLADTVTAVCVGAGVVIQSDLRCPLLIIVVLLLFYTFFAHPFILYDIIPNAPDWCVAQCSRVAGRLGQGSFFLPRKVSNTLRVCHEAR